MGSEKNMKYLKFYETGRSGSGLTKIWTVYNTFNTVLGTVQWFSHWRKYTYFSLAQITLDAGCLREIADFCEQETDSHKRGDESDG